jgi:hypothetical protein
MAYTNQDYLDAYNQYKAAGGQRTYNEWYRQFVGGSEATVPTTTTPTTYDQDYWDNFLATLDTGDTGTTTTTTGGTSGTSTTPSYYGQPEVITQNGQQLLVYRDTAGNIVNIEPLGAAPESTSTAVTPYQQSQIDLQNNQLNLEYEQAKAQLAWEQQQYGMSYDLQNRQMQLDQWYQQQQLGLQQANQEFDRWQAEQDLALENKKYGAQLKANPVSWLESASFEGTTPLVQPFMLPLSNQEYGLQAGQAIPGWKPLENTGTSTSTSAAPGAYQISAPPTYSSGGSGTSPVGINYSPVTTPVSSGGTTPNYINDGGGQVNTQPTTLADWTAAVKGMTPTQIYQSGQGTGIPAGAVSLEDTALMEYITTGGSANFGSLLTPENLARIQNDPAWAEFAAQYTGKNNLETQHDWTQYQNQPVAPAPAVPALPPPAATIPTTGQQYPGVNTNPIPPAATQPLQDEESQRRLREAALAGFAGYARGGQPPKNQPFIVGERGPELGMMSKGKLTIMPMDRVPMMQNGGQITPEETLMYEPGQQAAASNIQYGMGGLPSLYNPSRQYQARLSPGIYQQLLGYNQYNTGERPEDYDWRLAQYAPGAGYGGVQYRR